MPYEPLSVEDFARRLRSGRYRSVRSARQAVGSAGWAAGERAKGRALADEHFSRLGSTEPAAIDAQPGAPVPFDGELEAALSDFQEYVAAGRLSPTIKAIVLAMRDELRLRMHRLSDSGAAPPKKARQVASRIPAPPPPDAPVEPPKHDLSKLMEGAADDPGEDDEDDEDDEDGHQNGTSTDIGPEQVARMMTLGPDYEEKIAAMEANATSDKDRAVARTFGKLVREQVAKGGFSKK